MLHANASYHPFESGIENPVKSPSEPSSDRQIRELSREYGIPFRQTKQFKGAEAGYYLIHGVFGSQDNARKAIRNLNRSGITADILHNPVNGYSYVFVKHLKNGGDAIHECLQIREVGYADVWIFRLEAPETPPSTTKTVKKTTPGVSEEAILKSNLKKIGLSGRQTREMEGSAPGYYLIAGVFGQKENASRYVRQFSDARLDPQILEDTEASRYYVSIKYFDDLNGLGSFYVGPIANRFDGKVWVLAIADKTSHSAEIKPNQANNKFEPKLKSRPQGNFKSGPINDKLLEKADQYFDKMWYAEAADLYEMLLAENQDQYGFKVLQRAGDAHYFNTNMERAHFWYEQLFSRFKDDMTSDNLFKYAHSLKGIGKYRRAKRLMKLYNKALENEGYSSYYASREMAKEEAMEEVMQMEQTDYTLRNLDINSRYSEFGPMFYEDNQLVYASAMDSAFFNTRRYKWNNQPYLDLYVAKINEETDEVKSALRFSKKINSKYHEAVVTFSPDKKTLYFTRNNYGKKLKRDNKGINHLKIYMSTFKNGEWTEARELPFNSDEYSTGHPALSPDGKKLYFVSDMPGSIGQTDIFVVDVLGEGEYSSPRNLGPKINTERKEMFPFVNEEKLYFSSNGHGSIGGLDVYEAALDPETGSPQMPVNMGQPINSKKDDFSFIVDETTQKGFFASNRRGGKGDDDIYSFQRLLPEEPNMNAIAGVVTDLVNGNLMPEALVVLLDENNMKLKEIVTDKDGSFVFESLDSNTRYVVKTTLKEYQEDEQTIATLDNETVNLEVSLKRLEERIVVDNGIRKFKTDMIFFNFDRFNIRPDAAQELDELVDVMNAYPQMVIKIESHTDSRGPKVYNKYLSDKRAKASRDYLISKGISADRIQSAIGYGEERLLNECDGTVRCSREKHQQNRRSEFIILNM